MNIARKLMGYCPQFDAFDGLLTSKELLTFYTKIRGMSKTDSNKVKQKLSIRNYICIEMFIPLRKASYALHRFLFQLL